MESITQNTLGLRVDYLDWHTGRLRDVSVEMIEGIGNEQMDLSELYVKPGTMVDLDDIEFLESKIALML